jgi:hypothetical protein
MDKSIANKSGLFIILIFTIAPLWGYLSERFTGRIFDFTATLFCYLAFYLIFYEKINLKLPKHLIFYALFVFYSIISDKFIADKPVNLYYFINNNFIGGVLVMIIIEHISISDSFYKIVFNLSISLLIFAFIVIVIQQFISADFLIKPDYQQLLSQMPFQDKRLPSIYTWIGSLAIIGLSFFPILGCIIEKYMRNNKKVIVLMLFLIGAIVAFLNKSRFIMLNYLILFLLIPIYEGINFKVVTKYFFIISFSVIALFFISKSVGFNVDKIIKERILEEDAGGIMKSNVGTRILAFKIFGELFPEHPVLGKGEIHSFSKFGSKDIELVNALQGRSSQIHVGYLSLFYYYGLIGGIIYLLFLYFLTRKLYRDSKTTKHWGPFLGWIMFLATNLTGVTLYIFIMGIVISLFFNQYYLQKAEKELNEVAQ